MNCAAWMPVLLVSFVFCLSSCERRDTPRPNLTPESVRGCYDLNLSDWRPRLNLGEDQELIAPPTRIWLSSEQGSQGLEGRGYLLRPAPGERPSVHSWSYWVLEKGDVGLVWTNGFSGLTMKLHPVGTEMTLKGKAETYWDFPRATQTADVTAQRVSCVK